MRKKAVAIDGCVTNSPSLSSPKAQSLLTMCLLGDPGLAGALTGLQLLEGSGGSRPPPHSGVGSL